MDLPTTRHGKQSSPRSSLSSVSSFSGLSRAWMEGTLSPAMLGRLTSMLLGWWLADGCAAAARAQARARAYAYACASVELVYA